MKLLLSDGSGLTSRQVATQAHRAGHVVEVVAPSRICGAAFTRHVRRVHLVPAYGRDPFGWLEATLGVLRAGRHDVLVGTQEQVVLLAREAARVRELGVALAVPRFATLLRVQDKVAQLQTLREVGLAHPRTTVVRSEGELRALAALPLFLKAPVGTASAGVHHVRSHAELQAAAGALCAQGAFADGGVVAQEPVDGPLIMIQAVYAGGELVAWHANLREREGAGGGAAVKRSIAVDGVADDLAALGRALRWDGALSLDAILTEAGPCYIDVNPRLVEPGNAQRAGVDLVAALLDVSLGRAAAAAPSGPGRPGVRTHQLLLAVLGAAERGGRAAVLRELARAAARRGPYAGSREELTPLRGDPRAALPVLLASAAVLARPAAGRWFSDGAVAGYALTPQAWRQIVAGAAAT